MLQLEAKNSLLNSQLYNGCNPGGMQLSKPTPNQKASPEMAEHHNVPAKKSREV
jgi:hypothetical protein